LKSARIGFWCALASLALASASVAAPVNYNESIDGDLNQASPPTFQLENGVNVWIGTIGPTPTSNTQDSFFANLPAGSIITSIHWEYAANSHDISYFDMSGPIPAAPPFGTVLSHNVSSAGDNITDTGFSNVNPILPISADGQFKCEVTTGFMIATKAWKITITVETPLPTEPSTWGKVKALYR
jgi:hypothetical protein